MVPNQGISACVRLQVAGHSARIEFKVKAFDELAPRILQALACLLCLLGRRCSFF
jgi:hypothetical protein